MPFAKPSTRYAALGRWQALLVLAGTLGLTALLLVVSLTRPTLAVEQPADAGIALELFRKTVEDVHAGQNYYDAFGRRQKERNFPGDRVFNWRPPLYFWLLGQLPNLIWGQALVALTALATILLAYSVVQHDGGTARAAVVVVLLLGPALWCGLADIFLVTDLPAGWLIALSVFAYAAERRRLGVAAGLAALVIRELALLYCLISLGLAWRQRRRGEVVAWLIGFAGYGLYMVLHLREAYQRITPENLPHPGWLQLGGPAFVLATTRVNAYLIIAPAWLAAVYLPLALLGLAGQHGERRAALTVGAYVTAFLIVGIHPDNAYWGLLYAPLLPLGLVWAPDALRDLGRVVRGDSQPPSRPPEGP
jgi:hypothetical protein